MNQSENAIGIPKAILKESETLPQQTILFACVHNAGRSQMAEELFNLENKNPNFKAISAGTNPSNNVHEMVIKVMKELGINIADKKPKKLTNELLQGVTTIVTMGCGESCPYIPGIKIIEWSIKDPKDLSIKETREIKDIIHSKIKILINEIY